MVIGVYVHKPLQAPARDLEASNISEERKSPSFDFQTFRTSCEIAQLLILFFYAPHSRVSRAFMQLMGRKSPADKFPAAQIGKTMMTTISIISAPLSVQSFCRGALIQSLILYVTSKQAASCYQNSARTFRGEFLLLFPFLSSNSAIFFPVSWLLPSFSFIHRRAYKSWRFTDP